MTRLLRLVAMAIAIAGVIDPAITVYSASRPLLAIVALPSASPASHAVRDRLVRDLATSFDVEPAVTSDAAAAVVIGDRLPEFTLPDSLLISTVTTPETVRPGARIVRVDAPTEVPPATVMHLDVELEGRGLSGQTTEVTAAIGGLELVNASHRWTADDERWRSGLDVVPVGEPPYSIRVRLKPDTTESADATPPGAKTPGVSGLSRTSTTPVVSGFSRTAATPVGSGSNAAVADVVIDVRRTPFRVEFYDPRPSWATTFVRRALEGDARFEVAALSFTSRGISAQTGGAVPLADPRLDAFDVVIVGGLDRLSAADARSLDRHMRERGGAVVVLPDQRIDAGPGRDLLLGQELSERLLEKPAALTVTAPSPPLQASELLVVRALTPGSDVLARIPGIDRADASGSPVIASMPRGEGRLLLSGAMDAWRFRAVDNGAFDRFWQSTIAGLALAVPPPLSVAVDPPLVQPGAPAGVVVRVRSREGASVSASLDRGEPVRLMPDPQAGVYRGHLVAKGSEGRSTVRVGVTGAQSLSVSRTLLIQPDARRVLPRVAPALGLLASSHRGIDVSPEGVADLEHFLRGAVGSTRAPFVRHPMRSAWWILPFAACLSAEWWLRRRRGLR